MGDKTKKQTKPVISEENRKRISKEVHREAERVAKNLMRLPPKPKR